MNSTSISIPPETITFFQQQAEKKIQSEGWEGRDKELKQQNFLRCWITEEAFKQLLIQRKKWFRHRGLYFGDAQGAGPDFVVRMQGKEVTLGLRSIDERSLSTYKTVAYPDDRFRLEKETIAEYHVACHYRDSDRSVLFLGIISKSKLLEGLEKMERKYSRRNQEYFRTVPLEAFNQEELIHVLERLDS